MASTLPTWLPEPEPLRRNRLTQAQMRAALQAATRKLATQPTTPLLSVSLADRWLGLGMTGTGKTTWAERLVTELRGLYPHVPVYVLDSKGDGFFDRWKGVIEDDDPPAALAEPGGLQVWRPGTDDLGAYDEWFNRLLKGGYSVNAPDGVKRPKIVLVDELSSVCTRSGMGVQGYQKLLKLGRSLWISVVSLTQEASYVPRQVKNQSTHIVRFRLQDEIDAKKAARLMGQKLARGESPPEPRSQYGFFYCRLDKPVRKVIEYRDHSEFF